MDVVYHFTDTVHLPWIIESGDLRPGNNRIGNFPNNDFLWATTEPVGDRTSSSQSDDYRELYRKGIIQLVRFTLPAEAFTDWREMIGRYPAWTSDHVEMLVRAAREVGETGDLSKWRCRDQPLPITSAVAVEAKSYLGGRWMPINATLRHCIIQRYEAARLRHQRKNILRRAGEWT
jgi:hypothetical protein